MAEAISARNRNYQLKTHRRDGLIEWLKEMLNHSFVLNAPEGYYETWSFVEILVDECRSLSRDRARLVKIVPSVGKFHTHLPLREAFRIYDSKYCVSQRRHIAPTFNEIRHTLNLAQCLAMKSRLKLISFDGDQTLYSDGGNFEENHIIASSIHTLLRAGVRCAMITAAGYGLDGSKYEMRLQGLLNSFIQKGLTSEEVGRFYVIGGECNYLLRCHLVESTADNNNSNASARVSLIPVPTEEWQHASLAGPKPGEWPAEEIKRCLDITESSMRDAIDTLKLRAKLLRKERAVGIFPGGDEMVSLVPKGHGHKKLKREALDEVVLRVFEALRVADPPISIPYCAFNGGRDAWLDIGNKRVGVEALLAYFQIESENCLHVGDQFLQTGNDIAARDVCPCIWITSPLETEKILELLLKHIGLANDDDNESV